VRKKITSEIRKIFRITAATRFPKFLPVLMLVVDDIAFFPLVDPIAHFKNGNFFFLSRADHMLEPGIDDHFFADKAGKSIDGTIFSGYAAVEIHISSEQTNACPSRINDGILFGMNTPAQLITLTVGDLQLISKAIAMLEAVLCFSRGPGISCADDLIITDDDGSNDPPEAGAFTRDLLCDA
jgi:hypothetical protein